MGTLLTIVLAVLIIGSGVYLAFRSLKKEIVEGTCASCGPDKNCCSKKGKPIDISNKF